MSEQTETEQEQYPTVREVLQEAPGSLTDSYLAGMTKWESIPPPKDTDPKFVPADEFGESVKQFVGFFDLEVTGAAAGDQLDAITAALSALTFRDGPLAAALDPVGVAQNAWMVGLATGMALATGSKPE
jgi:hypothetical protein